MRTVKQRTARNRVAVRTDDELRRVIYAEEGVCKPCYILLLLFILFMIVKC